MLYLYIKLLTKAEEENINSAMYIYILTSKFAPHRNSIKTDKIHINQYMYMTLKEIPMPMMPAGDSSDSSGSNPTCEPLVPKPPSIPPIEPCIDKVIKSHAYYIEGAKWVGFVTSR